MQDFYAQIWPIPGIVGVTWWAAALIYYDIRQRRLPDVLTLPAAVIALGWIGLSMQWHALWGLLWSALYLLLALATNGQGMGGGDIKLAVSVGVVIVKHSGLFALVVAIGLTAVIALVWGLMLQAKSKTTNSYSADPPNGPAMLFATGIVIFTPW